MNLDPLKLTEWTMGWNQRQRGGKQLVHMLKKDTYLPRLLWSISLIHALILIYIVFKYAIAAPFWDDWELVPLISKLYANQLSLHDLWAQHNEHRIFFPRIIMLVCAQLSGFDVRWQMAVSILLALGTALLYTINIRRTAQTLGDPQFAAIMPVLVIAVFSMRQQGNWVWGWQLQIFLNILAVVGCITMLTSATLSWRGILLGMLCGIVATYSFANGMLVWILGLFLLCCLASNPQKRAYIGAWIWVSVLVIASYFWQYEKPAGNPPLSYALTHPARTLKYILLYMDSGIMVSYHLNVSAAVGAVGVGTFILVTRRLVKSRRLDWRVLLPYLSYALYAMCSAVVSAIGRVGYGAAQGAADRYSTISMLFWIALAVMLFLAIPSTATEKTEHATLPVRSFRRDGALCVMGAVFLLSSLSYWREYKARYLILLPVQQRLLQSPTAEAQQLYPFPTQERAMFLKQHHLALYR